MAKTSHELLASWDRRALKSLDAHYESGRFYARMNAIIGIPTVALAAMISTLAFATVANGSPVWIQLLIGFLGLIQAILASLHIWLRHAEVAERHRQAGARYAAIRRYIEQLSSTFEPEPPNTEALDSIRSSFDAIAREAPSIPAAIWRRTQKAYGGHGTVGGEILSPKQNKGS